MLGSHECLLAAKCLPTPYQCVILHLTVLSMLCTALLTTAYLCAEEEEPLPEPLQAAFGGVNGRNILDMLVTVSQHSLVAFQGETELHRQVSHFICCVLVAKIPADDRETFPCLLAATSHACCLRP